MTTPHGDITPIIDAFNKSIFALVKQVKRLSPANEDVECLSKSLYLAREIDPLSIIATAEGKIWEYREQIMARNESFFLENEFTELSGEEVKGVRMQTLLGVLKERFIGLSNAEKSMLWDLINDLLKSVIKYKLTSGSYK